MWFAARENWSRRGESNTPSAEYDSAALPLSYTGQGYLLCSGLRTTGGYIRHSGAKLEPAGGFEHPVCRVRFGRSPIELHRLRKWITE